MNEFVFFLTLPFGIESICKKELSIYGLDSIYSSKKIEVNNGYIKLNADINFLHFAPYLKTVNRVFLIIKQQNINSYDDIHNIISDINFSKYINLKFYNFNLHIVVQNSQFFSKKTIQAIVFRALNDSNKRNFKDNFDLNVNQINLGIFIENDLISIGIDCFGDSIHKRNYRVKQGISPLKENLASALILNTLDNYYNVLIDPFCGSATILTEAILFFYGKKNSNIKSNLKPGILNEKLSLYFKQNLQNLKNKYNVKLFIGSDIDINAIKIAEINIKKMLGKYFDSNYKYVRKNEKISIFEVNYENDKFYIILINIDSYHLKKFLENNDIINQNIDDKENQNKILIISNLPYGKRLDKETTKSNSLAAIQKVHKDFDCPKYFLTSMKYLPSVLGVKPEKKRKLFNGKIEVILFTFDTDNQKRNLRENICK